jgi:hypothetical protein
MWVDDVDASTQSLKTLQFPSSFYLYPINHFIALFSTAFFPFRTSAWMFGITVSTKFFFPLLLAL